MRRMDARELSGRESLNHCWMPGFADWPRRRGCWKMLKAFSPGARTPPPESVSKWSYHVSCLFHRHSHTAGEIPVYDAREVGSTLVIGLPNRLPSPVTLCPSRNYFLTGVNCSNVFFLVLYSAHEHALNFSRLSVLLVRPSVRKLYFIDECRPKNFKLPFRTNSTCFR